MILSVSSSCLKGFRFPLTVISYAVWAYHRFSMSLRDVEDLLAERGVTVSYETIRVWVTRFGPEIAGRIRRARLAVSDKWHLDEVVIMIGSEKHWLWRAVDSNGTVLDILMQMSLCPFFLDGDIGSGKNLGVKPLSIAHPKACRRGRLL